MLVIDNREPKGLINKLSKLVDTKVEQLDIGDYYFSDKGIIIERKEIGDLVNSVRSGRLQKQLAQMEQYPYGYVIIIGYFEDLYFRKIKFNVNQWLGLLSSLNVRYKSKVIIVKNQSQFIKLLLKLYEKTDDGKDIYDIMKTDLMKHKINTKDIQLKMLSCVPGISLNKAKLILENYNLKELYTVDKKELTEIKGIGDKLAENIKVHFR